MFTSLCVFLLLQVKNRRGSLVSWIKRIGVELALDLRSRSARRATPRCHRNTKSSDGQTYIFLDDRSCLKNNWSLFSDIDFNSFEIVE